MEDWYNNFTLAETISTHLHQATFDAIVTKEEIANIQQSEQFLKFAIMFSILFNNYTFYRDIPYFSQISHLLQN